MKSLRILVGMIELEAFAYGVPVITTAEIWG